jgi:hypothetical protein
MKRKLWMSFCVLACLVFFCGFIYMIHLANLCIASDREVARLLNDPKFTRGDWAAYLGCCTPLGFSLIWGARFWLSWKGNK